MPELIMNKAPPFINGYSLKKEATKCMLSSDIPEGWFKNNLCSVIDFDKGATILFNQSLV